METVMYYEIKLMDNPPVLIGAWKKGFRFAEHGRDYQQEIRARWDSLTSPAFYILDMSRLETVTFEGVMKAAQSGVDGPNASLKHPMNRGSLFVTRSSVIKAAAKGMGSDSFGHINIKLFPNLKQALAHVNSLLDTEQRQAG